METEKPQTANSPTLDHDRGTSAWLNWKILVALCLVLIAGITLYSRRGHARTAIESTSPATVAVVRVAREDLFREKPLPAEFRPYAEVELHAKVSGYVEQISVDFGDKVKAGQLLATLEVPELQDQLHSAIAMRQKAEADYTNAHLTYDRMQQVNKEHPNLVAQQELDNAFAKNNNTAATIAAAKADVEKFETLVKYTKITAPFSGVVTKRYADPGSLIQAGTTSDTQSMPLVRLSDNYHLRLDFYVTQDDVKAVHPGDPVEIRVKSLNGKTFTGTITRFTHKVEEFTRLMETEIEVPNPNLEIVPGMYASVLFKVEEHAHTLAIPPEALTGEKNSTVYVVNASQEIESRPVTLGLEMADKYEVLSGLKEGDLVMIGSRALVHPGQKVEAKIIEKTAAK